jgi:hypothetical protein
MNWRLDTTNGEERITNAQSKCAEASRASSRREGQKRARTERRRRDTCRRAASTDGSRTRISPAPTLPRRRPGASRCWAGGSSQVSARRMVMSICSPTRTKEAELSDRSTRPRRREASPTFTLRMRGRHLRKALHKGAEVMMPPERVMEGVTIAIVRAPGGVPIGFSGP